jgi:hypothetical protein
MGIIIEAWKLANITYFPKEMQKNTRTGKVSCDRVKTEKE